MNRERLADRRLSIAFGLEHEGQNYRASVSFLPDGRLGEVFLDVGKYGSALQTNAQNAAMLASMLLQYGVPSAAIRHSISGPIAAALEMAEAL